MTILAISKQGAEFLYRSSSAHKVAKSSAQKIADKLNEINFRLSDGETWCVHDIDTLTNCACIAERQAFKLVNHGLKEYRY